MTRLVQSNRVNPLLLDVLPNVIQIKVQQDRTTRSDISQQVDDFLAVSGHKLKCKGASL
jgi:hypothetical protein